MDIETPQSRLSHEGSWYLTIDDSALCHSHQSQIIGLFELLRLYFVYINMKLWFTVTLIVIQLGCLHIAQRVDGLQHKSEAGFQNAELDNPN